MKQKFFLLKNEFKERGVFYGLKRIIFYLFRPITNLMKRSMFLVNLRYGVFPNLKQHLPFYQSKSKIIKLPQSELIKEARKFWYSNTPGTFNLDGEKINRRDIFTYGGPNPKFTCSICQKSEWLSRVRQKNLFIPHSCSQVKECQILCSRQGDESWTHYHQNFNFFIGCDSNLSAPKCLNLRIVSKERYADFPIPHCDQGERVSGRQLAYACQIDVVQKPVNINWSNYDFLFMSNGGYGQKFPRPKIPIILYGHDFWPLGDKGFQWVINWVKPDILLTSYPTQWKENFKIPSRTKVIFYPLFPSLFFTRPNLDDKKLDLLVIGAIANSVYKSRRCLSKQVSQLTNRYKIEFSHRVGALGTSWKGPAYYRDPITKAPVSYLNKWSEYLASAKYVIFGRIADPRKQLLVFKYYETLGSGAIPIFPEVPDLKLLGVKPFEHYIPLSEIEGNNDRLAYFLDHYEDFRYIAENAVKWYKEKSDKMLFENFENLIREITDFRYPKRLL